MSRATFRFEEAGKRRYLSISNRGNWTVFDADLRDKARALKQYRDSILYRGHCKAFLLDDLPMGVLHRKAMTLWGSYRGAKARCVSGKLDRRLELRRK